MPTPPIIPIGCRKTLWQNGLLWESDRSIIKLNLCNVSSIFNWILSYILFVSVASTYTAIFRQEWKPEKGNAGEGIGVIGLMV